MGIAPKDRFLVYGRPDFLWRLRLSSRWELKSVQLSKGRRVLWELTNLPIRLKEEMVDLFFNPCNFLPPVKVCKYVVTIHDIASFTFAHSYPPLRRFYYQYAIRNAIRVADRIITVSQSSKDDLVRWLSVPEEKIRVIHNGVSPLFCPITDEVVLRRVCEKYDLPEEFIFTLGVLEPKKNTEGVIRAYALMKGSFPNLPKLAIGGSKEFGWKNQRVFQLVKKEGLKDFVTFIGPIEYEDLPAVYSLAKLFIFPSFYEGFGLPVLEAMACGTPVITSNTSSLPEVAADAAVLVNPYRVEEIKRAMREVLQDEQLRVELREKGLARSKQFSWISAGHQVLEVLAEVGKRQ